MEIVVCFVAVALLIAVIFIVFLLFVRRDYRRKGRLTLRSNLLELLVWDLYMSFPFLYNPPQMVSFWSRAVPVGETLRIVGVVCIIVGLVSAFGTMFWFGLRRAFGLQVSGLVQSEPYRVVRNPQIVGGSLLVVGSAVLSPLWYTVGWVMLYGVVWHVMVMTEEVFLLDEFGAAYARYCQRVPRYVGVWWRRQKAAA